MSISNKVTFTTSEVVTVHVEGFEPIKDLRKVSEWNGLWELREMSNGFRGKVILMVGGEGFAGVFANALGEVFGKPDPREATLIAVSPSLLIKKEPA